MFFQKMCLSQENQQTNLEALHFSKEQRHFFIGLQKNSFYLGKLTSKCSLLSQKLFCADEYLFNNNRLEEVHLPVRLLASPRIAYGPRLRLAVRVKTSRSLGRSTDPCRRSTRVSGCTAPKQSLRPEGRVPTAKELGYGRHTTVLMDFHGQRSWR